MNLCPITYESCGDNRYAIKGIKKFSRRLTTLNDFPYSAGEQRTEAALRASKMSVQGIQPKLSVRLNLKQASFEITDKGGRYLIKPQHNTYPELPENEDLSMRLAELVGISVPLHGLIYCKDKTFSYIIKRFDREGKSGKLATEDFAQLSGMDRDTKYNFSMEKLVPILDMCTFPAVERVRLFRRCIFNFLIGNEDMHLKNFSLITRNNKIELSPAYDFLSTTTAFLSIGKQIDEIEEVALSIKGKKRKLTRKIWIDYFGMDRLQLNSAVIAEELTRFSNSFDQWYELIKKSFLSEATQEIYTSLIEQRRRLLKI
ncbi:MAG: HipA domain-containing protein [Candidatus Marinimicrobia bacterium]|nr:HipA domain-containing protein [Candidatus Neomarinimicrobiota bacterium]